MNMAIKVHCTSGCALPDQRLANRYNLAPGLVEQALAARRLHGGAALGYCEHTTILQRNSFLRNSVVSQRFSEENELLRPGIRI